jgi:hypothetical protein
LPNHRDETEHVPVLTMHEDDPVLIRKKRGQTRLTRRTVKRIAGAFGTFTFLLIILLFYQVIQYQRQINADRANRAQDVDQAICSLIDAVPPGDGRIDAARAKFHCGAYVPEDGSPVIVVPPTSGNGSTVSPAPSATSKTSPTPRALPTSFTFNPTPPTKATTAAPSITPTLSGIVSSPVPPVIPTTASRTPLISLPPIIGITLPPLL